VVADIERINTEVMSPKQIVPAKYLIKIIFNKFYQMTFRKKRQDYLEAIDKIECIAVMIEFFKGVL
jgi:hypothetical protein